MACSGTLLPFTLNKYAHNGPTGPIYSGELESLQMQFLNFSIALTIFIIKICPIISLKVRALKYVYKYEFTLMPSYFRKSLWLIRLSTVINSPTGFGTAVTVYSTQTAIILLCRPQCELMRLISFSSLQAVKPVHTSHIHSNVFLLQNTFRYPFICYSIHPFYFVLIVFSVLLWYLHRVLFTSKNKLLFLSVI
jgi:hypothetical protein